MVYVYDMSNTLNDVACPVKSHELGLFLWYIKAIDGPDSVPSKLLGSFMQGSIVWNDSLFPILRSFLPKFDNAETSYFDAAEVAGGLSIFLVI